MMKRIITVLLLVVCVAATLSAQDIIYQQGSAVNKKAYEPVRVHLVPGVEKGQIISVEPELKAVGVGEPGTSMRRIKAYRVRLVDSEWNESKAIKIENSAAWDVMDTYLSGRTLHVLLFQVDGSQYALRHLTFEATTLQQLSDNRLLDLSLERQSDGWFKYASSPNEAYHGVAFSVWSKHQMVETHVALYDKDMKQLWKNVIRDNNAHQLIVTNEGTIVIGSLSYSDKNKDETVARFSVANAEGAKTADYITTDDIENLSLLGYNGGNIVASVLEGKGGKGLIQFRSRSGITGRTYPAMHGYLFNIDAGRMITDNRHEFSDEERAVFYNSKIAPITGPNFLSTADQLTTTDGGYVIYHRMWKEETRNVKTGMTTNEAVYSRGMLLVYVDNAGNVVWTRGIMQNNQNANWPNVEADLFEYKGNLYVLMNEAEDAPDEYTLEPALNSSKLLLANLALAIYKFTPQGEGSKQMLVRDGKHLIFTPLSRDKDGLFYFLTGSIFPKISSVVIP